MSTPTLSSLRGTGYKQISMPKLSPEQQQLFSQAFGAASPHIGGAIGSLGRMAAGDEESFKALEAPAFRDLQAGLGQIASRFSGMGTGARRSSGFNLATSNAAQELAERLQSQRLGLQQNAISQLMGLYSNLLGTQTFDTAFLPKKRSFLQELLGSAAPGIGQTFGTAGSLALMGM